MKFCALTPELCATLVRDEFGGGRYRNKTTKALDVVMCKSLIGTSYVICSGLWNLIDPKKDAQSKHFFKWREFTKKPWLSVSAFAAILAYAVAFATASAKIAV
eukprot:7019390-Ditylum_brightwellii.AAC.1